MKTLFCLFLMLNTTLIFAQKVSLDAGEVSVSFTFLESGTKGTIEDVETTIELDFSDLSGATISGSAKVNSLSTENKMRDKHLKSKDFFHAKKYPEINFKSTKVEKVKDRYFVTGSLTIKGTTKEVVFAFRQQEDQLVFEATINAMDFDISPKKERERSNVNVKITVSIV